MDVGIPKVVLHLVINDGGADRIIYLSRIAAHTYLCSEPAKDAGRIRTVYTEDAALTVASGMMLPDFYDQNDFHGSGSHIPGYLTEVVMVSVEEAVRRWEDCPFTPEA